MTQTSEMLLGALVSDAACLGLHWLYDPNRISEVAARQDGQSAFTEINAVNYYGVSGYFVHGSRRNGMLTQYGEVLRLTIQSMNAHDGVFDVQAYTEAFAGFFGPGGPYCGYIDRPTRGALANIAADHSPSGIDDDQVPAISRLPAILAGYHDKANMEAVVAASMQVTNVNDIAAAYSSVFANLLSCVMRNEPLPDALDAAAKTADDAIKPDLMAALATSEIDSTVFAGEVGRACHLPTAGPVMFHILKHSADYRDAVERNVRAGGDNAGRSILIGAVMGRVHGAATQTGIPLSWILQLEDAQTIWTECERLGCTQ